MSQSGQHTYTEIFSQPALWQQALAIFEQQSEEVLQFCQQLEPKRIILTGCGSTYYLAAVGAWLMQQQTGIPAVAYSASELLLFPQIFLKSQARTLFITVSRSGTTRETVEAARLFRQHGSGKTLSITCTSESVLAQESDMVLAVDAAREESPVQTRSFSSMAVILQALALAWGESSALVALQGLPAAAERILNKSHGLAKELGSMTHFTQFVFLGTGALYGLACEAMLKMAEMALVPASAYHAMEFRHGPRYAVNDKTLLIALLDEKLQDEEIKALHDARHFGATIAAMGEGKAPAIEELGYYVRLQSRLHLEARVILYLPFLQLLGYYQAVTRGYDPDNLRERMLKS